MADEKGPVRPRAVFRDSNPPAYGKAQLLPEMTRQLAAIDRRTAAVKERFRAHSRRFQEVWVAAEAARLLNQRAALALKIKAPAALAAREMAPRELMVQARRNVMARITRRLSDINRAGEKMRNTVIRTLKPANLPKAELTQAFTQARKRRWRME